MTIQETTYPFRVADSLLTLKIRQELSELTLVEMEQ